MPSGASSFDQEVVRILRQAPGQRLVLLTRQGERLLTTRFFLHPVKLALGGLVEQVTVTGEGSIGGLPETLTLALEGYRVRAGLGELAGLPEVVAAGVTSDVGGFLPDPGEGLGYAYVSTHFIAGESTAQIGEQLAAGEKLALLRRLLRLLARLHERLVVYGDLKPHNVIAVGEEPWLIDLDTMRRVPRADLAIPTRDLTPSYAAPEQTEDQLTYLASDVYSFGRLVNWLLENESERGAAAQTAVETWRELSGRAMAEKPAERPSAQTLLEEAGLSGDGQDEDPAVTVPVLDILPSEGDREGGDAETVQAWAGVFAPQAAGAPSGEAGRDPEHGAREAPAETAGRGSNAAMVFRALSTPPEGDGAAHAPADAHRAPTARVAPSRRRRSARWGFAAAGAAALVAGLFVVPSLLASGSAPAGRDAGPPADAPRPADAGPPPFSRCATRATRVLVATLEEGERVPPPAELLSWFAGLHPGHVEVYRFGREDSGRRYVSFELARGAWPAWNEIAGDATGDELCARLGNELVRLGAGAPEDGGDRTFDFIGRRPEDVVDLEPIGDLRGVANGDTYAAVLDWLDPLELAEPECRAHGGWLRQSYLEIACEVKNTRERTTAVSVIATLLPGGLDPIERDRRVVLEPGESTDLTFTFDEYDDQPDTYCDCAASTLP